MKRLTLFSILMLMSAFVLAKGFPRTGTLYLDNSQSDLQVALITGPSNEAILSFTKVALKEHDPNQIIGTFTLTNEQTQLTLLIPIGNLKTDGLKAQQTALFNLKGLLKNNGASWRIKNNSFIINNHQYIINPTVVTSSVVMIVIQRI